MGFNSGFKGLKTQSQQDRQQGGTHDNNANRNYSHMPR